jgi:hypothetical protein
MILWQKNSQSPVPAEAPIGIPVAATGILLLYRL